MTTRVSGPSEVAELAETHQAQLDRWSTAVADMDWTRVEDDLESLFEALDAAGWRRAARWSEPPPAEAP